jgi:hypothetical protein
MFLGAVHLMARKAWNPIAPALAGMRVTSGRIGVVDARQWSVGKRCSHHREHAEPVARLVGWFRRQTGRETLYHEPFAYT